MSYVVRLGGRYLQGETGWGERSCASELDERGARAALKLYPYARTEPCLHAYIDGICHRCQEPEPRVSERLEARTSERPPAPGTQRGLFE
jgi:hypothetical protein